MKIVIDIPKHIYEWVTTDKRAYSILNTGHRVIIDAIKNATPLGEAGKDINAPTTDCISREEAIKCVEKFAVDEEDGSEYWRSRVNEYLLAVEYEITNLSSIKLTQWHRIKTRPLTKEEKDEMYLNDNYYTFMYDCEMPDDEQEVLVKTKWGIEKTTYHTDDGCYFEDYEDEDDVIAWQPLPKWEE
jgi:hypothetical protein